MLTLALGIGELVGPGPSIMSGLIKRSKQEISTEPSLEGGHIVGQVEAEIPPLMPRQFLPLVPQCWPCLPGGGTGQ